jgi:hypothetical protein
VIRSTLAAAGLIVVVSLLAGAGLPAIFAIGIRALGTPARVTLRPPKTN